MANLSIDGLAQGLTDQSATAMGTPGMVYEDGYGNKYNYGLFSVYCSAYFQTVEYEQANGVLKLTKAAGTSTTLQNGGVTLRNMTAGYYGFTQLWGNAEAYVDSSLAAGAPLAGAGATGGVLYATVAGRANIIAQAVDTGAGVTVAVTVNMQIPK